MSGGNYLKVMDQLALTSGGPTTTIPMFTGKAGVGSERLKEGRPVLAEIDRDGIDGALVQGTIGLWGANLHNAFSGPASGVQSFKGADGASTRTVFTTTTDMDYSAFSNFNYIVTKNGTILAEGADADADHYQISDGTGKTIVTFGASLAVDDRIEVHKVTPVALVADAENSIVRNEIVSKTVVWALGSHDGSSADLSRTIVGLRALN